MPRIMEYLWAEYLATIALIAALLLPFLGDVHLGWLAALLAFPAVFAVSRGIPTEPANLAWLGLLGLTPCIVVASFFFTFGDTLPKGLSAGLYVERRWVADVTVFLIVGLGFSVSMAAFKQQQIAAYREVYRRFLHEQDLEPKMEPAELGCGAAPGEKCYFGRREVVLGSFQDWNQEVKAEIGAQLKAAVVQPKVALSRSTKRVISTFVEQKPAGSLLAFPDRLEFSSLQSPLSIPVTDIILVQWLEWYLIVTVRDKDKPLVFRFPTTTPPWVLAAALLRAMHGGPRPKDTHV